MQVTWFLPTSDLDYNNMSASVWIRALQLIPFLRELGIECHVNDPESAADISIFVRQQGAETEQLALNAKAKGSRVIFDLCVNYFDESSAPGMADPVTSRHVEACKKMVDIADAVTCASRNIADRAGDFHDTVRYLPDSINHHHFNRQKDLEDFSRKHLTLAWSGVAHKAAELEPYLLDPDLKDFKALLIAEQRPSLMWKRFWKSPFSTRFAKWRYEDFPAQLLGGEICFAPRDIQDSYNNGHSFFKVGVFLAQGIPVVASPVPSYEELLNERPCGALCKTRDQFVEVLEEVRSDRDKLRTWSRNGVEVMKQYRTERLAEQYVDLFEYLTSQPRPSSGL